ncbi:hypothetical protein [Montanilutibacter psychrotolerans]|uniref:Uncharacterized protein n=1 Tax=Montanilutibacter psychrotolerans TaxID=1327343 RepID=A0A3M8SV50_9GAMM|nr:hypothetical protein [Lysobacter psychrotolerans]RNF85211.1 hypothetical protein EER27_05415 [Lysobacter psychrotolerans]
MRFENVVFAGSVVSTRFDWRRFTGGQSRRVGKVLNFVASADWVVAFFPKLFQRFRWQDLGSAGHDGFDTKTRSNGVEEVRYVAGAHSAGIQERCWDWIAEFVINGRADLRQLPGRAESRHWCVEALGRVPWVIWLLILLAVGLLAAALGAVLWLLAAGPLQFAFLVGLATPLFLWALWMALTRG